jgi:glycosyltransferase involved in cell wall biosynthesis
MPAERRLLYVLPFPPRASAADGGSRAVAENLRRIAASATVAVVYVHEEADPQMDADIAALCDRVDAVTRPRQRRGGPAERALQRLRLATGLLLGTPIWAQALHVPGFERQLAEVAREWSPDLIEIDNHVMGRYLDALDASPAPRVLVVHEPGAGAAGRAWAEPSRMLRALDARAWRIFETRLLRRVQCVVALTEADSQSLRRRGVAVPIETIGLGVSVPERAADPLGGSPPTVLFVGNFRHTPNVDAATRLVFEIWPRVRAQHADAVLSLVGPALPAPLVDAAGVAAQIEVTGAVPEVEPYLERAAVCVAPLREGGGMRVKVIEALAAGKAVVASPLAVAGLAVENGREVLLATHDDDFAAAISRVLSDSELRASLARAGRAWALANAGADRSAAAFDALYGRLIGDSK